MAEHEDRVGTMSDWPAPSPCPACGGAMVPIVYGLFVGDFESLPSRYVLAGCCKPVPAATARCEACGHEVFEE